MRPASQPDPKVGSAEWQEMFDAAVAEYEQARGGKRFIPLEEEKLHELMIKAARSGIKPEYQAANVLGDTRQTFGIEIEFEGCEGALSQSRSSRR